VKHASRCTTCRECIRPEKFQDRVHLGKRKDVFEFTVESLGIYKPQDIVTEAISKLKEKAVYWYEALANPEEAGAPI
jgi:DNA-directed RNA polymerase I and III subunit RPAC1